LIAILSGNRSEIVRVINEKFYVIELIAPVEFGQKLSRRPFIRSRIEAYVENFVRRRINCAVWPELLAMEADHFLFNHELILVDG
jgi:hypothetical protein